MPPSDPVESIRPLRIAMLTIHSSPLGPLGTSNTGGMSVYVLELARWLGSLGHSVDIFSCIRVAATETVVLYPNVRLIQLAPQDVAQITKEQLSLHWTAVFETLESFRRKHALVYDLIHSHYWLSGMVGAMARDRWACPHVTMFHTLGLVKNSTASGENESDRRIAHERWLAKVVDMIVVPAVRERENLIHLYNAEAQKIEIIPCGVNLDLFRPMDRIFCRKQLNIRPDAAVALFVGRFAPLKGIDALLGAVADLKKRMLPIHLVVVGGDGPDAPGTQALIRLVKGLDIQNRVTFAGRIDQAQLPAYYSACDLLVVPSHYESFGLVVLEAMACGIPVVATRVGAVETIIQQGINGLIIGKPRRDKLAQGIARVLDQPGGERTHAGKIRDTVTHCGWDRIAAAVIRAYNTLIRAHKNKPLHPQSAGCHNFPN